jgi:probable addiction module antidote protein
MSYESTGGRDIECISRESAIPACSSSLVEIRENKARTLALLWSVSMTTKKDRTSISHDEALIAELRKDPELAAAYLREVLEEDDPRVFLIALRHLAQAHGIAKVAKAAGVERESLYRSLSANGNPRLSTLLAVVKAIGVKLTVEDA